MRRRNLSLVGSARSARGCNYVGAASRAAQSGADRPPRLGGPTGFTLVELLLAMAVTLLMMGAVVTLFANVSESVRNRRATIEMSGQLRHARNVLQADLAGATCPGLTWRRPEENQGYIEIIEGPYREGNASGLLDGIAETGELDRTASIIPSSNLPFNSVAGQENWVTDGAGLGDYDDILMLTVRNEHEPFVGRVPNVGSVNFSNWTSQTIESPLAEVVWFAVENPMDSANGFFGEPGMRTIYRRALLVAPWINPYLALQDANGLVQVAGITFRPEPGLVRILANGVTEPQALAALIAFQDRYDLSVRLEFDPLLDTANGGRWKIVANKLGDLTKRENRYGHHFLRPVAGAGRLAGREFPFAMVSYGSGYSADPDLVFVTDLEIGGPVNGNAEATANVQNLDLVTGTVVSYNVPAENFENSDNRRYAARPLAYVDDASTTVATARAMLNDEGQVVRVIHGPAPLWGSRRGEDVMLTDVLAFDLRVYDPGAPLYGHVETETVLEPTDAGWRAAFQLDVPTASDTIGDINTAQLRFVGQGAYVDLGYGGTWFTPSSVGSVPWFLEHRPLHDVYMTTRQLRDIPVQLSHLAPGYAVYDTWSFHYENNGLNEDGFWLDGNTWSIVGPGSQLDTVNIEWRRFSDTATDGLDRSGAFGPDSIDERETTPPYDKPLRGAQVLLRVYERDSRQIRQVRVNQHFLPE